MFCLELIKNEREIICFFIFISDVDYYVYGLEQRIQRMQKGFFLLYKCSRQLKNQVKRLKKKIVKLEKRIIDLDYINF
jgi:hypothetical protein